MSDAEQPAPRWQTAEGVDPASIGATPVRVRVGNDAVVVVRTSAGLRAMERACPHQKATLTEAVLMGGNLRCPKHNFLFRLSDGKGINCPGLWLKLYAVREIEGRLEVAI